jgi:MipA family protein
MRHPESFCVPSVAGLLLAMLWMQHAAAHGPDTDDDDEGHDGTHWGIGVGVGVERKPYTNIGNKTEFLPPLFLDNRYVRIFGPVVDAKLPPVGPLSFTLRAKFSFDGYKESDAPILNGMDKRKAGLWLGGTATWHAGFADLFVEALADVGSPKKGAQFKLAAEREFEAGQFSFTPRAAAIWLDEKYVDYYYGVKSTEALATRPQYDGRSTVNAELGLRIGYKVAQHQMLFLDISGTSLGSAIKGSPLVNRTTQTEARIGYLYRF